MSFGAIAQSDTAVSARAFLIGENEKHFESLVSEHGEQLLNVCKNNMNKAYKLWVSEIREREFKKLKMTPVDGMRGGISQCSECGEKFYTIFNHTSCHVVEKRITDKLNTNKKIDKSNLLLHVNVSNKVHSLDRFRYLKK